MLFSEVANKNMNKKLKVCFLPYNMSKCNCFYANMGQKINGHDDLNRSRPYDLMIPLLGPCDETKQ